MICRWQPYEKERKVRRIGGSNATLRSDVELPIWMVAEFTLAEGEAARETSRVAQSDQSNQLPISRNGQPKGLTTLFFVELWERFSYYGMRAILVFFMVAPVAEGGLGFSTVEAALFYGNYTMAVYLLALPGGYIADKITGPRRAVLLGGIVIAFGHFALAWGGLHAFYLGIVAIALGTGLFKPSISAMVGALYEDGDPRRDAGFTVFYMGVNVGGLLAPLVTGFLAQSAVFKDRLSMAGLDPATSWHWGFASAGVGMVIALVLFARRAKPVFGEIGGPPQAASVDWRQISALLIASGLLLGVLLASDQPGWEWLRYSLVAVPLTAIAVCIRRDDLEARRIAAIFVFFLAAMVFWAAFEQAGLSIALFADRLTDNTMFGWTIPSAWYQSLNPLFVILLAPLLVALWTRMGEWQPSTPAKFVAALTLLALAFLVMVPAAAATPEAPASPLWLVVYFMLITLGELCLSPVGLSAMTKLAPARLVALMLGVWFLAAAFGNKLAGVLGSGFTSDDPAALAGFFAWFAVIGAAAAAGMLALTPWLRRQMSGVA